MRRIHSPLSLLALVLSLALLGGTVGSSPVATPPELRHGLQPAGPELTPAQAAYVDDLIRRSEAPAVPQADASPGDLLTDLPTIDVWYGDEQSFGVLGLSQNWCNILGTVSDPDTVETLVYTLNGGASVPLSIGPDYRRLAEEGDFNVDLAVTDLVDGPNLVVITATDRLGNVAHDSVTVNFDGQTTWPLPYGVDWDAVTELQDATQITDGRWEVQGGGIRTTQVDYDRILTFGDVAWTDYELTTSVTFHAIEETGPFSGSSGGFGFVTRWTGHTDVPVSGWQPKSGWLPSGPFCYYRVASTELQLDDLSDPNVLIEIGDTFNFKIRVTSTPGAGGLYKAKVWEQGTTEPAGWNLIKQRGAGDMPAGSLLFYAHHTDVTLGDVQIDPIAITISNVQAVMTDETTAQISWTTDVPADSRVEYGLTTSYGSLETDPALVTDHVATLSGLMPDQTYHFRVSSETAGGDQDQTGDRTFSTVVWNVGSDDFNVCELDTSTWTWVDPLGDSTLQLNGTQALITAPAGVEHRLWGFSPTEYFVNVPRLVQPADDEDFTMEVKFESTIESSFQTQGVYFREDENNLMFVHFAFDQVNDTEIVALKMVNGDGQNLGDWGSSVGGLGIEPLSARIQRSGDQWTVWYSLNDGVDWQLYKTFTHAMVLNEVAVYASNSGAPAPEMTAVVDYVLNVTDPIGVEDEILLQAPELDPVADVMMDTGESLVVPVSATDPDLDEVTLSASGLPGWAVFTDLGGGDGELALDPGALDGGAYQLTVTATDPCGLQDSETFWVRVGSGILSDDFNACALDPAWTFTDPLGTAAFSLSGTEAVIELPAGQAHAAAGTGPVDFTDTTARLLQGCNDVDFELQAFFDAPIDTTGRQVGLLVRQDANDFLQVLVEADALGQPVFSLVRFTDGARSVLLGPTTVAGQTVPAVGLRLDRFGPVWSLLYSLGGGSWLPLGQANTVLSPAEVGVFAGNTGNPAPAFATRVDYFFETENPVSPEDPLSLNAPVLDPLADQFLNENSFLALPIAATDLDGEFPALSAEGLPAFAVLNDAGDGTGQLDLAPQLGDAGVYDITVVATDGCGLFDRRAFTLVVGSGVQADFVSDDFSGCDLDAGVWTVVDPVGDGTVTQSDLRLTIDVPAGVAHDAWGSGPASWYNDLVRVSQPTADGDFSLEFRLESGFIGQWTMAGVLVSQDENDFMRLEFGSDDNQFTSIAALRVVNGVGGNFGDFGVDIAPAQTQPLRMRIVRKGDQWTQSYSVDDGATWQVYKVFQHALTMTEISLYAGNSGGAAPANTAVFDYVFNLASPIVPEDGYPCGSTPDAVADLAASRGEIVDADGTLPIRLTWTPPANGVSLDLYRKGFGFAPEYDDDGGAEPAPPADPAGEGWEFVANVDALLGVYDDEPAVRDQWFYTAVTRDDEDALSAPSAPSGGVLNHKPADVHDGVAPGQGDNAVDGDDLALLDASYGLSAGEPGWDPSLDVGPTVDGSPLARPSTDNILDFEDLMMFALQADSAQAPATPPPGGGNALVLAWTDYAAVGDTFSVDVQLTADGTLQGLSLEFTWDTDVLTLEQMLPGAMLGDQGAPWWFAVPDERTADMVLLGEDGPVLAGEGVLVTLVFRVEQLGAPGLAFGQITARTPANDDGTYTTNIVDEVTAVEQAPLRTVLHANSPNPFNPSTSVAFDLARDGRVRVQIYDMRGSLVRTLVDGQLPAGAHSVRWDGRDVAGRGVASGTYLLRLQADGQDLRRRMMLLK